MAARAVSFTRSGCRRYLSCVSQYWRAANLVFPSNKSGDRLPQGNLDIEVEGRPMEAIVAKIAVNVVRPPELSSNELPAILRTWFGDDVGLPGRSDRVRFRRDANMIVMEPLKLQRTNSVEVKGLGALSSRGNTARLWANFQSGQLELGLHCKPTSHLPSRDTREGRYEPRPPIF